MKRGEPSAKGATEKPSKEPKVLPKLLLSPDVTMKHHCYT